MEEYRVYRKRLQAAERMMHLPGVEESEKKQLRSIFQRKTVYEWGNRGFFLFLLPLLVYRNNLRSSKRIGYLGMGLAFCSCLSMSFYSNIVLYRHLWGDVEGIVESHYKRKEQEFYNLTTDQRDEMYNN